jgi:hypothetical protein
MGRTLDCGHVSIPHIVQWQNPSVKTRIAVPLRGLLEEEDV